MKRDWKPGDVARLRGNGLDAVAIRTTQGSWAWVDAVGSNPVSGASFCHDSWGGEARPLVAIDPKDHPNLPALLEIAANACAMRGRSAAAKAVRDLAAEIAPAYEPDRPKEPTGLGAVVEDEGGERWVLRSLADERKWCHERRPGWAQWSDIKAVRVLSEGVPS